MAKGINPVTNFILVGVCVCMKLISQTAKVVSVSFGECGGRDMFCSVEYVLSGGSIYVFVS